MVPSSNPGYVRPCCVNVFLYTFPPHPLKGLVHVQIAVADYIRVSVVLELVVVAQLDHGCTALTLRSSAVDGRKPSVDDGTVVFGDYNNLFQL